MPYTNDESGFYQLIPKGVGFEVPVPQMPMALLMQIFQARIPEEDLEKINLLFQSETSDETLKAILEGFDGLLENARKDLSIKCKHKTRPYIDTQEILYVKSLFIQRIYTRLKNECPTTQYRSVVNTFLADTGVLFTDGDEHYYHGRINKENISAWTPYFNDAKKRRVLYDTLSIYTSKGFRKEDIPLYNGMLDKIFTVATARHQNMRDWVQKNLPYNESTVTKNLMLLRETFPEYAKQITCEVAEKFFLLVLPEYVSKVAQVSNNRFRPDSLPISVKQKQAQLFVCYKTRLRRLENLYAQYLEREETITSILNYKQFQYMEVPKEGSIDHEQEICEAIQAFFIRCGVSLRDDGEDILRKRIVWAMRHRSIPCEFKPVFLVYMTICCKRNIAVNVACPVQEPPIFNSRCSKRKQRCLQLDLLRQLCDILSMDEENRMKNWIQYLAWQGTEIQSVEEAQFWKQQLGQEYERLPVIGFQLCCVDYIADCIPLRLERLSYNRTSPLHLGGYHKFWIQNQPRIESGSEDLGEQHDKILKQYKKFWNKPKEYFWESKEWLRNILEHVVPIDLSKFEGVPVCDEDELRRLVLETELQLCVTKEAQLRLQKMCIDVYGFKRGLFASFNENG